MPSASTMHLHVFFHLAPCLWRRLQTFTAKALSAKDPLLRSVCSIATSLLHRSTDSWPPEKPWRMWLGSWQPTRWVDGQPVRSKQVEESNLSLLCVARPKLQQSLGLPRLFFFCFLLSLRAHYFFWRLVTAAQLVSCPQRSCSDRRFTITGSLEANLWWAYLHG